MSEHDNGGPALRPIYIFDLDGTLALIEHRLPFIVAPSCPHCGWHKECDHSRNGTRQAFKKDWRAFFAAVHADVPNKPVIRTMRALRDAGAEVWIWSGRSDECQKETKDWLAKNCGVKFGGWLAAPEEFRMRKAGDYRDDVVVKSEWLSQIEPPEYKRLTAVFDDHDRVVQMWRDAGVPCFQIASGGF